MGKSSTDGVWAVAELDLERKRVLDAVAAYVEAATYADALGMRLGTGDPTTSPAGRAITDAYEALGRCQWRLTVALGTDEADPRLSDATAAGHDRARAAVAAIRGPQ